MKDKTTPVNLNNVFDNIDEELKNSGVSTTEEQPVQPEEQDEKPTDDSVSQETDGQPTAEENDEPDTEEKPVSEILESLGKDDEPEDKSDDAEDKSDDAEDKSDDAEDKSDDAEDKSDDAEDKSDDAEDKSDDAEDKSDGVLPHDPPTVQKRLRKQAKKLEAQYNEKITELQKRIEELSSKPTEGKLPEAEAEELRMYRRRYAVETDPEIASKYDTQLEATRSTITDLLLKNFRPEDHEKLKSFGNFDEFATAQPKVAAKVVEALAERDPFAAKILESEIARAYSLKNEKKKEMEKAASEASDWFQKRQQQTEEQRKQYEAQQSQVREHITKTYNTLVESPDFKPDPVEGLTGEKLAAVKEENEYKATAKKVLDFAFTNTDINGNIQIAVAAAKGVILQGKLNAARAKIKQLEAQIDRRVQAGSVSKGSRAVAGVTPSKDAPKKTGHFLDNIEEEIAKLS